jgi:nickel-type superoxide dismutase maturation protease
MSKSTPLKATSWYELLLLLLRWRHSVQVSGDSMLPAVADGDVVLYRPVKVGWRVVHPERLVGEIIVARHPYRTDLTLIKRVAAVLDEGHSLLLLGDNAASSSDSASFGAVPATLLQGRVTSLIRQPPSA